MLQSWPLTIVESSASPIWPIAISTDQFGAIALGVLALPVALHFMGMYPGYGISPIVRLRQRVMASFVLFGVLIAWNYLERSEELSRGILIASMAYALIVPFLIEAVARKILIKLKMWGQPTIVLGAGDTGTNMIELLQRRPELGMVPVAMFDDDSTKWGKQVGGVEILGPLAHAASLDQSRIRTAILAVPMDDGQLAADVLDKLRFENVIIVPRLFGVQSLWVSPIDLDGVVALQVTNNLSLPHNYVIKRLLDYAVSIPAAILSLPVLLVSALWIMPTRVLMIASYVAKSARPSALEMYSLFAANSIHTCVSAASASASLARCALCRASIWSSASATGSTTRSVEACRVL